MKHCGEYLDIHCGGVDNIFPHHTNEIAQSEAYLGHKWCNYWFHVHHLNDETGKMSKSKGEFLTVSLLESKGYDPLAYRFFCLQSHYRKPLVFSYEALDQASATFNKLLKKISNLSPEGEVDKEFVAANKARFIKAIGNDMNTALAITNVYDILKANVNGATKLEALKDVDSVLSLDLVREEKEEKADAPVAEKTPFELEIEALIVERAEAKKAKNYARADEIRNGLKARGVTLVDTAQGTTYTID